jgi:uncharacterized Zn finger protein
MSRWEGPWPPKSAKKPPPAHGIKLKKAGTTWWGQRWIEALERVLRGDAGRLARGRTYARAGRTHDLEVQGGAVSAKVTGSRSTPYVIRMQLKQLSVQEWQAAITGMAEKAQFAAELLAGQMPEAIDEVFVAGGCSLFPRTRADLETSCTCPDWGDPCKHVAATHYVLGEALDRDPFLLFELRGRTKPEVLQALREARGAQPGAVLQASAHEPEIPTVALGKLSEQAYDAAQASLPSLQFAFDQPTSHAAVLLQLGAPAAWSGKDSPVEMFAPLLRAAAETARRIALAEPALESEMPPSVAAAPKRKPSARSRKAPSAPAPVAASAAARKPKRRKAARARK